jgi:hypothetical protein
MAETYGAKALRIGLGQVGVKEQPSGSNSGAMVCAYQKATDVPGTGWPWCAAFVHWCYANAGAPQPYRSAYVPALRNWYQAHGRKVTAAQVQPGDFVIYEWEHDQTPDHIGLFRRWMDAAHTEFEAVEGNTSVGNNSNGGQVMVRLRPVSLVAMFARPVGSRVPVGTKFDPVTGQPRRGLRRVLPYLGRH